MAVCLCTLHKELDVVSSIQHPSATSGAFHSDGHGQVCIQYGRVHGFIVLLVCDEGTLTVCLGADTRRTRQVTLTYAATASLPYSGLPYTRLPYSGLPYRPISMDYMVTSAKCVTGCSFAMRPSTTSRSLLSVMYARAASLAVQSDFNGRQSKGKAKYFENCQDIWRFDRSGLFGKRVANVMRSFCPSVKRIVQLVLVSKKGILCKGNAQCQL